MKIKGLNEHIATRHKSNTPDFQCFSFLLAFRLSARRYRSKHRTKTEMEVRTNFFSSPRDFSRSSGRQRTTSGKFIAPANHDAKKMRRGNASISIKL